MASLQFSSSFPEELKHAAESVLGISLTVGKKFDSADSYSYLLTGPDKQYVGKIFRFSYWPPKGKLETVQHLLDQRNIPHEEILHLEYSHPLFKYGWQISSFIPGGTARDLRDQPSWNSAEYLEKLGSLLKAVHQIRFEFAGTFHDESCRYASFADFAEAQLAEKDFNDWPPEYEWTLQVIDAAKTEIRNNLKSFQWSQTCLVHDDANENNVLWRKGNPLLIDWMDCVSAPAFRDFASITYRFNEPVLQFLEQGYGSKIDHAELRLHQLMRFIRVGSFYYFEDNDVIQFELMMRRLQLLLKHTKPFGAN